MTKLAIILGVPVAMLATIGLGIAIVHYASELFRWYFAQA